MCSKIHDGTYSGYPIELDESSTLEIGPEEKTSALTYFRSLESIDDFIQHSSNVVASDVLICSGCCDQLTKVIEKAYKQTQEQARFYSVTIHEHQGEHYADGSPRHVDCVDDRTTEEQYSSLTSQSEECEVDLQRHIKDIQDSREKVMTEIQKDLQHLASIESELTNLDEEISVIVNHSDRTVREMNFLGDETSCIVTLFDLTVSLQELEMQATGNPGTSGHSSREKREKISVINGMRLMYFPSHSQNLNWAEINQAWSCLALLVCCLRNQGNLPGEAVMVIKSDIDDPNNSERTTICLKLRPLRRSTMIVLTTNYHPVAADKHSTEEVLYLFDEGNIESIIGSDRFGECVRNDDYDEDDDDTDDFLPNTLGQPHDAQSQKYQYHKAVVALAAFVCATARDLCRVDCLTSLMYQLDLGPLLDHRSCKIGYQRVRVNPGEDLVGELCMSVQRLLHPS